MLSKKLTIMTFEGDRQAIIDTINRLKFLEISDEGTYSIGFIPVLDEAPELVKSHEDVVAFRFRVDQKRVPGSAIRGELNKQIKDLTDRGEIINKALRADLKEQITRQLYTRAIASEYRVGGWFDFKNNLMCLEELSETKVDLLVHTLQRECDKVAIKRVQTKRIPKEIMTQWVYMDSIPESLTIDDEAKFAYPEKGKASFSNLDITDRRVVELIAMGGECVELAVTVESNVSLVISSSLGYKKIKHIGLEAEGVGYKDMEPEERWQAEAFMNSKTAVQLHSKFVKEFGGLMNI